MLDWLDTIWGHHLGACCRNNGGMNNSHRHHVGTVKNKPYQFMELKFNASAFHVSVYKSDNMYKQLNDKGHPYIDSLTLPATN